MAMPYLHSLEHVFIFQSKLSQPAHSCHELHGKYHPLLVTTLTIGWCIYTTVIGILCSWGVGTLAGVKMAILVLNPLSCRSPLNVFSSRTLAPAHSRPLHKKYAPLLGLYNMDDFLEHLEDRHRHPIHFALRDTCGTRGSQSTKAPTPTN
jgi:hypothetical protein